MSSNLVVGRVRVVVKIIYFRRIAKRDGLIYIFTWARAVDLPTTLPPSQILTTHHLQPEYFNPITLETTRTASHPIPQGWHAYGSDQISKSTNPSPSPLFWTHLQPNFTEPILGRCNSQHAKEGSVCYLHHRRILNRHDFDVRLSGVIFRKRAIRPGSMQHGGITHILHTLYSSKMQPPSCVPRSPLL